MALNCVALEISLMTLPLMVEQMPSPHGINHGLDPAVVCRLLSIPSLRRQRNRREVPTEISGDRLISIDEWAVTCGVTKRQVFRWISAGSVPPAGFSLGQVRRWKLSTLKLWLDTRASSEGNMAS